MSEFAPLCSRPFLAAHHRPSGRVAQVAGVSDLGAKDFGEYHVHTYAIDRMNPFGPCSPQAVGGHYNPNNAAYGVCNPSDVTTCEVGDLSGKHGHLTGMQYRASYTDSFLPLSGSN